MGFLLMIIICYLIGSIPCGYLIGKRNNIDIRRYGSGNIGATNAFRVLGTQLGLLVLFCDAVKGFLPVLIVNNINPDQNNLCEKQYGRSPDHSRSGHYSQPMPGDHDH
jgi:acyl-phosphate glycerol 3-phosphate acyltransferase